MWLLIALACTPTVESIDDPPSEVPDPTDTNDDDPSDPPDGDPTDVPDDDPIDVPDDGPTDEVCGDGLDNDQDGLIDDEDGDCMVFDPNESDCSDGVDDDGDGWADCLDDECWGVDACAVTATTHLTGGELHVRESFEQYTFFSSYGFGYTSQRTYTDLSINVDATLSGSVVIYDPVAGGTRQCDFVAMHRAWRGNASCTDCFIDDLAWWGAAPADCQLDQLLPSQLGRPGLGSYSASDQLWLRGETVSSSSTGNPNWNFQLNRTLVLHPADPLQKTF